jgi:hypothetical protein
LSSKELLKGIKERNGMSLEIEKILYDIFLETAETELNLFDTFLENCHRWYERPAHTLTEIRLRENTKVKGDMFELFCVKFLKQTYQNVWLLHDTPPEILSELNILGRDMGIDLVVQERSGLFTAVQCKYKRNNTVKRNVLGWKQLSTFYALCLRSGPWNKYIVLTNCEYTRHQGKRTPKDKSICLKSLQNISRDTWLKMCDQNTQTIETTVVKKTVKPNSGTVKPNSGTVKPNLELLREKRLERFGDSEDQLVNQFKKLNVVDEMIPGHLITKEKRQEIYGRVNGGGGSTGPEKYQRNQIETITGIKCPKTNMRINWRTNELIDIAHPMTKPNGYDFTEDFDGVQQFGENTVYVNLKCVVGAGGSQTRTLRDECYHFVESQLKYLLKNQNCYFANIFDGDQAAAHKSKFDYLLDIGEYSMVRDRVYVGDLKDYFKWVSEIR